MTFRSISSPASSSATNKNILKKGEKKMIHNLKIMLAAAFLLAGFSLFANEDAVRARFNLAVKLQVEQKHSEAIKLYTDDYYQIEPDGKKIDLARIKKLNDMWEHIWQLPALVEKGEYDKINHKLLVDYAELMFGKSIPAENRAALEKKLAAPEGKEMIQELARQVPLLREVVQSEMQQWAQMTKIISVKVNGDKAVVVYERPDLTNPKFKIVYTEDVVKVKGEWFFKRCIGIRRPFKMQ